MSEMTELMDESFGYRLCVHSKREDWPNFSMDRQMTVYDAAEVCLRITHFLRNWENGISQSAAIIDAFELHPDEPSDDPKVCVIWNPESRQIRFSVTGMPVWDALIALESAATYFRMLVVREEAMSDGVVNES